MSKGFLSNLLLSVSSLLFAASFFATGAQALNEVCTYKQLPMFVGGASNEYVNCIAHDPATNMVIYAGNTTSTKFAPAANEHAFIIGMDIDGNWKWGKFFYNVSYAVSTISGCKMSSDGSSLSMYAMSNSIPVVMDINTIDGSINKFFSVEWTATTSDKTPTFVTYAALWYDKADYYDGYEYIY
jgi:hypothetical protein